MSAILLSLCGVMPWARAADTAAPAKIPKLHLHETVLGTMPGTMYGGLMISPGSRHVFSMAWLGAEPLKPYQTRSGPWAVYRDGRLVGRYDGQLPMVSYMVESSEPGLDLHFSQDGEHYAFAAQRGGERFVVYDGVEQPHYDHVELFQLNATGNQISAAGDAVAYIIGKPPTYVPGNSPKQRLVVSGPAVSAPGHTWTSPVYGEIYDMQFSPDGRELLYTVNPPDQAKGLEVFLAKLPELKPVNQLDPGVRYISSEMYTFSADSKHLAFQAYDNGMPGTRVILDGRPVGVYPEVSGISFSPDGNHLSFVVKAYGLTELGVVVDGVERPLRGRMASYALFSMGDSDDATLWSPDSKHFAYAIRRNEQVHVVLDGVESAGYQRIAYMSMVFLEDGRLTYSSFDGSAWTTHIGDESLPDRRLIAITPDGVHRAFLLGTSDTQLDVDGKRYDSPFSVQNGGFTSAAGKHFSWGNYGGTVPHYQEMIDGEAVTGGVLFSPGQNHRAIFDKDNIAVDGVPILPTEAGNTQGFVFDGDDRFHVFAMEGNRLVRVDGHF